MFNLTDSPEFMEELQRAICVAAQRVDLPGGPRPDDPAETWLTTKQTLAFLKLSASAFHRFKGKLKAEKQEHRLCVSYALGATEPRYQLLSLQTLMREGMIGGKQPELSLHVDRASASKPTTGNGKLRSVVVRST